MNAEVDIGSEQHAVLWKQYNNIVFVAVIKYHDEGVCNSKCDFMQPHTDTYKCIYAYRHTYIGMPLVLISQLRPFWLPPTLSAPVILSFLPCRRLCVCRRQLFVTAEEAFKCVWWITPVQLKTSTPIVCAWLPGVSSVAKRKLQKPPRINVNCTLAHWKAKFAFDQSSIFAYYVCVCVYMHFSPFI